MSSDAAPAGKLALGTRFIFGAVVDRITYLAYVGPTPTYPASPGRLRSWMKGCLPADHSSASMPFVPACPPHLHAKQQLVAGGEAH